MDGRPARSKRFMPALFSFRQFSFAFSLPPLSIFTLRPTPVLLQFDHPSHDLLLINSMNNNQQLPCRKIKAAASSRKIVPLIALSLFLIAIIPVYYPFLNSIYSPKASDDSQSIHSISNPAHHSPFIQLHLHQDKQSHVAVAAAAAADDDDDDDPEIILDIPTDADKDHLKVVVVQVEEEKAAVPVSSSVPKVPIQEEPPANTNIKNDDHHHVRDQKQKPIKRAPARRSRRSRGGGRKRKRAAARNRSEYSAATTNSKEEARPAATVTNHKTEVITRKEEGGSASCDISVGEWVPNPDGPYYTNSTCSAIQEHQNCLKFGRPDTGFLKWRWKPEGCELPIFEPVEFLEMMRGKKMAFVGDSVSRNHMQSLICLLSTVEEAVDVSEIPYGSQFKRYEFRKHNLIIAIFWSPYLVRTTQDQDPPSNSAAASSGPLNLFLDEPDPKWTQQIPGFDYLIISAGHWFFRPTMFYIQGRLAGCLYCPESHVPHLTSYFSYRRAFRTAFGAIVQQQNFSGITFLRSFAPSHFENGYWDKGGDCVRERPLRAEESRLEGYNMEHYRIQLEEVKIAQRVGRGRGLRFRMMDVTRAMLMRPDGHPSKYGHWPSPNVSLVNDCVHWCLPGPVDSWNDFLIELLRREGEEEERIRISDGR